MGKKVNKQIVEPARVRCGECRWFKRDTEGISRNEEGEYFMGTCERGLHPDTVKKQFANKARVCRVFVDKLIS